MFHSSGYDSIAISDLVRGLCEVIEGGIGGASTKTGLQFERDTDLRDALLEKSDIHIKQFKVYQHNELVGYMLQKHDLYKFFLELEGVNWKSIISKKLLPDEAYFSINLNTLIVIEKKYQQVAGSVDEKLQTCLFKKQQYEKLCMPLGDVKVEYVYVLNDWFKEKAYKDVLDFIEQVGCRYYFNRLPYELLGIDE